MLCWGLLEVVLEVFKGGGEKYRVAVVSNFRGRSSNICFVKRKAARKKIKANRKYLGWPLWL